MAETVTRETTFDVEPEELWRAISDERELERWLADEVELDPTEGGELRVRLPDGEERRGTVLEVEAPSRLSFTWAVAGREPSLVELTVAGEAGRSTLTVTETSFDAAGTYGPLMSVGVPRLRRSLTLVLA